MTDQEYGFPVSAPEYSPTMDRVLEYLMDNPNLTSKEIADALDVPWSTVKSYLSRLRNRGVVEAIRL